MPAKSKAQQRLMAAAEHGATFPAARKLRASMTPEQLHDFAAGSMPGKPEHVTPKRLHPALQQRAAAVKAAHAQLSTTEPGFRQLPGHEQLRRTQAHVSGTRPS